MAQAENAQTNPRFLVNDKTGVKFPYTDRLARRRPDLRKVYDDEVKQTAPQVDGVPLSQANKQQVIELAKDMGLDVDPKAKVAELREQVKVAMQQQQE